MYVPVGHSRQVPLDVAPMLALYVPAGHAVHAAREVDAVLVLYVPCGQRVQTSAPLQPWGWHAINAAKEPAAQSVQPSAPAAEYFPAAQGTHFDMPALAANVPAAQLCMQTSGNHKCTIATHQSR